MGMPPKRLRLGRIVSDSADILNHALLMDVLSASWLTEMDMEDPNPTFMHDQYGSFGDSLDDHFDFYSENFSFYPSYSPKSSNPYFSINSSTLEKFQTEVIEKPAKQLRTSSTSGRFCPTAPKTAAEASSSSSSCLISFGNSNSNPISTDDSTLTFERNINYWNNGKPKDGSAAAIGNMDFESLISQDNNSCQNYQGTKRLPLTRDPSQNLEHVLAERKRREKQNLLFISLSALVPGLTKMDKASVLGEAVKYLKQLQERVKMLEEQTAEKMVESVVTVKRHQLSDDGTFSSYDNSDSSCNQPLFQIEVRVSKNKDVLIRIHCQKQKGFAVKIIGEIEKLHLTVINSSFIPFGEYVMDITIVAQIDDGFSATAWDIVRNLRLAFLQFM